MPHRPIELSEVKALLVRAVLAPDPDPGVFRILLQLYWEMVGDDSAALLPEEAEQSYREQYCAALDLPLDTDGVCLDNFPLPDNGLLYPDWLVRSVVHDVAERDAASMRHWRQFNLQYEKIAKEHPDWEFDQVADLITIR